MADEAFLNLNLFGWNFNFFLYNCITSMGVVSHNVVYYQHLYGD